MYLDSFFSLVEKSYCFPYWCNVPESSKVFSLRTFSLASIVFVGEDHCLLDFGGPFYIKLGVSELRRNLLFFGGVTVRHVGRRIVLFNVSFGGYASSMVYERLIYSRRYFLFRSYVVSAHFGSFSLLPFLVPVLVLKWFRYKKRFWLGLSGVKVYATERGLRE